MHTRTTESLAAVARMSAQDTVSGQMASRSHFIASITSNPRRELRLGAAVFSPIILAVSSNNTEASQPYDIETPGYISYSSLVHIIQTQKKCMQM